jgi:hypothetical protein
LSIDAAAVVTGSLAAGQVVTGEASVTTFFYDRAVAMATAPGSSVSYGRFSLTGHGDFAYAKLYPFAVVLDAFQTGPYGDTTNIDVFFKVPTGGCASCVAGFNGGSFSGTLTYVYEASAAPEPVSWAMMIGGLGVVGGIARNRRRLAAPRAVEA